MERASPPKPRRNEDASRETLASAPHAAGLRPSGHRVPGPHCRAERLHRARHLRHEGRGIGLTRRRGRQTVNQLQQLGPIQSGFLRCNVLPDLSVTVRLDRCPFQCRESRLSNFVLSSPRRPAMFSDCRHPEGEAHHQIVLGGQQSARLHPADCADHIEQVLKNIVRPLSSSDRLLHGSHGQNMAHPKRAKGCVRGHIFAFGSEQIAWRPPPPGLAPDMLTAKRLKNPREAFAKGG